MHALQRDLAGSKTPQSIPARPQADGADSSDADSVDCAPPRATVSSAASTYVTAPSVLTPVPESPALSVEQDENVGVTSKPNPGRWRRKNAAERAEAERRAYLADMRAHFEEVGAALLYTHCVASVSCLTTTRSVGCMPSCCVDRHMHCCGAYARHHATLLACLPCPQVDAFELAVETPPATKDAPPRPPLQQPQPPGLAPVLAAAAPVEPGTAQQQRPMSLGLSRRRSSLAPWAAHAALASSSKANQSPLKLHLPGGAADG